MTKSRIGKFDDDSVCALDVQVALESRVLVTANSGGGKSYLVRRMIEVLCQKTQTIIIDPEGEFASLRERFDFIVAQAGAGADAVVHPKTAALMARRLLETHVSAILDISELKVEQRHEFVAKFVGALMEAPRALWGELLVVIDEAHLFAPEKGQGESVARSAVTDLATRGRKRGFCLMAATQRISKFDKNVSAELLNRFIGRTGLDIDVKRAAFDLGMTPKDAQACLPQMQPGQFYAFGPAVSRTVALMRGDAVETTHPKPGHRSGKRALSLPKPTDAIRAVLPQLADLAAEQEAQAKSEADLRRELAEAQRALKDAQRAPTGASAADVERARLAGYEDGYATGERHARAHDRSIVYGALQELARGVIVALEGHAPPKRADGPQKPAQQAAPEPRRMPAVSQKAAAGALSVGEAAILRACLQYPDGCDRAQLTALTGYKKSSRDAYISRAKAAGLVETHENLVHATDAGRAAMPDAEPLPTGEALQALWLAKLPAGEAAMLRPLIAAYPESVGVESLSEESGFKKSSRDAYLSRLGTKRLVERTSPGYYVASKNLFD